MAFKIIVAFSIGIYLLAGVSDQSELPTKHFYGVKLRDSYKECRPSYMMSYLYMILNGERRLFLRALLL